MDLNMANAFESRVNPETPGAIHEGVELGYALAVSFGAVMDKPGLVGPKGGRRKDHRGGLCLPSGTCGKGKERLRAPQDPSGMAQRI